MKKGFIVIGATAIMIGLFVFGMNRYKEQEAYAVRQIAASNDSPLHRPDAPTIGTLMAKVEIVEFFDPACEACREFHPHIKSILERYKSQVLLSLRYATFHQGSDYVAQVLEAARLQGMEIYLKSLEAVLAAQPLWADHRRPQPELVWTVLDNTGLDVERARREMNDPRVLSRLKQDAADIIKLNVRKTPALFINDQPLQDFSPEGLAAQVASEVWAAYKP